MYTIYIYIYSLYIYIYIYIYVHTHTHTHTHTHIYILYWINLEAMQNNNYLSLINFKVKTSLSEPFFIWTRYLKKVSDG